MSSYLTALRLVRKFDEMRVGTTFGDVACMSSVPEPATIGMIVVGAIGLLMIRKR